MKATISSFIFCCCFSVPHPLPAFVSFFAFSSFNLIFPLSHTLLPHWPPFFKCKSHFIAFDRKPPVVLRIAVPRMGHDIALAVLTHLPRRRAKDVLTPCEWTIVTLSLKCGCMIEEKKDSNSSLCYWITPVQWFSTLAAQRIT